MVANRSFTTTGSQASFTLTLPTDVDGDQVKADYKNGVLALTLPKHAAAKPKQIAVSVG